jgi:hypothetical protein
MRSANDKVQRERSLYRQPNLICLIQLVSARHDHQKIDIAVGMRLAVGVRAEQDDLVGLEPLGYFAREAADN